MEGQAYSSLFMERQRTPLTGSDRLCHKAA